MLNRTAVFDHITSMPGSLAEVGSVANSTGNYVLEMFPTESDEQPSFRSYHFDSDTTDESIARSQVEWYVNTSKELNAQSLTPAFAFFHIPLREYLEAMESGRAFSGSFNEHISVPKENTGLFAAFLQQQDVKAGFCGHDHTK
jgi:hypothetical protein